MELSEIWGEYFPFTVGWIHKCKTHKYGGPTVYVQNYVLQLYVWLRRSLNNSNVYEQGSD